MRRLFPVLAVAAAAALLSLPAHAGGYASAQAQAGIGYATPQAALAPAYGTCGAGAAPAAPGGCGYGAAALAAPLYAPQQQVIVQRQVVPQAVYVQPQAAVVLRQRAYAPVLQQQIVSPYAGVLPGRPRLWRRRARPGGGAVRRRPPAGPEDRHPVAGRHRDPHAGIAQPRPRALRSRARTPGDHRQGARRGAGTVPTSNPTKGSPWTEKNWTTS
jgi:hypothetical protein